MLNIGKLADVVDSVDYYLSKVASGVEDYYTGNGEAPGYWTRAAAADLGLHGHVDEQSLSRLLRGQHPTTGETLPGLRGTRTVPGFDLTFRAPKSVALLWALSDTATVRQVSDAHDAAVVAAVDYLEEQAGWSRRGAGGRHAVQGRGFVAAAFRHRASRDRDPLLHTHVLVANAVQADDGRWGTLDATRLYRHAKTAGYLYQAQLRHELTRRLGVAWEPVVNGAADLAGVPEEVIRAFSQRRQAIEQRLAERGETSAAAAQVAALDTRKPKGTVDAGTLFDEWVTRAAALGFTPEQLTALLGRTRLQPMRPPQLRTIVDGLVSPAGLTSHTPTFTRREVIQALCERVAGGDVDAETVQTIAARLTDPARTPFIPLDTRATPAASQGDEAGGRRDRRYTTAELLAAERQVFAAALRRRGEHAGIANQHAVDAALTDRALSGEQVTMVRRLCGDGDGIAIVVGKAGSGKTAALAAARDAWHHSKFDVVGCALAGRAAQELDASAGIASHTIDRMLAWLDTGDPRGRLTRRSVLVVDEAGMVDTRTLARLVRHTTRARAKLVLVGDHHQLPEIHAGGAFRGLVDRLDAIGLHTNRRQHHAWERDALDHLRDGTPAVAVNALDTHGRITTTDTLDQLRDRLIDDWWNTVRTEGLRCGVMIALRVADVDELNRRARHKMTDDGALTGPEVTTDDRAFRVGDRVVARRNRRLSTPAGATIPVMNGQRGTITAADPHHRAVTVRWDDRPATVVPAGYLDNGHLDHGYAITGHRAQGLTVNHTWTHASDATYREWGYVAVSRGRHHNQLYITEPGPETDELDHGAWQPATATSNERLIGQLNRSNAHQTATDALRSLTTNPPQQAPRERRSQPSTHQPDEALGLD